MDMNIGVVGKQTHLQLYFSGEATDVNGLVAFPPRFSGLYSNTDLLMNMMDAWRNLLILNCLAMEESKQSGDLRMSLHIGTGWWFGCHQFYFPIYWECHHPN